VKVEGRIFAGVAVFFAIVATVYGVLSREVVGTTALTLSAGLSAIVAVYLLFTSTRIDPRPEDNELAEIADGAGEYGFYSPHSWWPIIVAGSAAVTMLGLAFGWWLTVLGAIFLIGSAIGFVFEYYHGHHAAG
jgi:hypothetical protein